jgi:hypothetical protein
MQSTRLETLVFMKRNPVVTVGAVLMKPAGMVTELAPVRLRTLEGICRKLMAPGLWRGQEDEGRRLLRRLLDRPEKPFVLEITIGVLLTARLCDQDLDPKLRAIIAVVGDGAGSGDYPVQVFHDPFHYDLRDAEQVSALVTTLVQAPAGATVSKGGDQQNV